jgi:hypothetical protein
MTAGRASQARSPVEITAAQVVSGSATTTTGNQKTGRISRGVKHFDESAAAAPATTGFTGTAFATNDDNKGVTRGQNEIAAGFSAKPAKTATTFTLAALSTEGSDIVCAGDLDRDRLWDRTLKRERRVGHRNSRAGGRPKCDCVDMQIRANSQLRLVGAHQPRRKQSAQQRIYVLIRMNDHGKVNKRDPTRNRSRKAPSILISQQMYLRNSDPV